MSRNPKPSVDLRKRVGLLLITALLGSISILSPADAREPAVAATSITLDATSYPPHKVFQRDRAGIYSFALRGSITGPCTSVEASFAGRPYITIDPAPGAGFAGTLVASTGQGTLAVRCANAPAVMATIEQIGIGDVYVVAGQSNAEGQGIAPQSYTTIAGSSAIKPTVFTEADEWKIDNDQTDIHSNGASVWPIVGGYVVANTSVPVAFITAATGGSKLVSRAEWQPGGAACLKINRNCYDNMIEQVAQSGVNGVRAVLWFQGEGDAQSGQSRGGYNAALDQLAANVRADLPGAPRLVAGVIGPWIFGTGTDDVRLATMDAWGDNPHVLAGPQAYDVRITGDGHFDDKHFATDDELQTLGYRWWKALDAHFYSGSDGRGPTAVAAAVVRSGSSINVTFSDAVGLSQQNRGLTPSSWRVTDNGSTIAVVAASVVSSTTVRLDLATPVSSAGTVAVSFALNNTAEGAIVPVDASNGNVGLGPDGLPADPFRDLAATRADSSADGARVAAAEVVLGALVEYLGDQGTMYGSGGGYNGNGQGWFNYSSGPYPASIAATLAAEGYLDAGRLPRDPLHADLSRFSSDDFLIYRCKDRVAVFTVATSVTTDPVAAAWWADNECITAPITRLGHAHFVLSNADHARVAAAEVVLGALEGYLGDHGTMYGSGGGHSGNGQGWFNYSGRSYPASIAATLAAGGYLDAGRLPRDPLHADLSRFSSDDFLIYRCKDRVAVFTVATSVETDPAAAAWWFDNGCISAPLTRLGHPHFVLSSGDGARVAAAEVVLGALEGYLGDHGTMYGSGGGYNGNGQGWFNYSGGSYPASIAATLAAGGYLDAGDLPYDPLHADLSKYSENDFLIYRCRDRVAVFTIATSVVTDPAAARWWADNDCTTAPINRLGHPHFVLSE